LIKDENIAEESWRDAFSLFCCEKDDDITDFVRDKAVEYEKRDKCRTYLYYDEQLLEEEGKFKVVGFFSLAMKTLKVPVVSTMSGGLKRKLGNLSDAEENLVAFLIGQLGRDSSYPKDILNGKEMLQACYDLIASARDILGGRIIMLDCKPADRLCRYYEDEGYIDITENGTDLRQYMRFID